MDLFGKFKKKTFPEKVESFRKSLCELEQLKRDTLLDVQEYKRIEKAWAPCKSVIEKGEASESILRLNSRHDKVLKSLDSALKKKGHKQEEIRKSIISQISKEPALLPLLFMENFMSEGKYNSLVCTLVKAHKEGQISDAQLKKLTKFKKTALKEDKLVHVKDNRTQYADTIIIDDENRILFTVRNKNDDFCPAGYCLPGGHIEEGETPREAAQRELREETGIELELHELVPVGEYMDSKSHIHYFCAHSNVEPVCLQEEEQQQWEKVAWDEIDTKPLIINLQHNLENIIAIPKELLNKEADNVKKVYFDGRTFKKGGDELSCLRTLKGYSFISKSDGSCSVYAQEENYDEILQKSSSQAVPKRILVPDGDNSCMVTIWVDPDTGAMI
jgi:mutator protein MutT